MRLLIFFAVLLSVRTESNEKRIILHSATDIAQELLSLKSEFESVKAKLSNMTLEISSLKAENIGLRSQLAGLTKPKTEHNSVYVRWGRTECPGNGTDLIYKGYIAGGLYNDGGGGANVLCLPDHPTWSKYKDGPDHDRSYIYGAEFDIYGSTQSQLFDHVVNNQDQPCAVCQTRHAITRMFPGRADCYSGWSLEYSGYLMSNLHGHDLNLEYFCLDSSPEANAHGGTNDDQAIVYLVEAKCGSLPCPPYVEGREIACVQCSK